MDYHVHALTNGIRIIFKPSPSPVTHCCFIINAGSRDEAPGTDGLAHFIEHLIFKRTEKRSTSQILNRLEMVGADLNAYTTKEYTCVHASFMQQHLERCADLFEDILFHSTFPDDEADKERGVILDEIASYLDQPEEAIQDDFEGLLFKGHSLGNNILGTPETVQALTREHIKDFISQNYATDQMAFAVSGNYTLAKVIKICERYFGGIKANHVKKERRAPLANKGELMRVEKPIAQTHCVTGIQTYPANHPDKFGLLLLNNYLGGMGMSSRLNLEIREKYGIAYTIESNYTPLTDTGMFSIYFGTDAGKYDRAMRILNRELKKLRDAKMGVTQLHQAKQKFIGQIALSEENRMGIIIAIAKNVLDYGYSDTFEEVVEKVNAVTADQLLAISNEVLDNNQFMTLVFDPE